MEVPPLPRPRRALRGIPHVIPASLPGAGSCSPRAPERAACAPWVCGVTGPAFSLPHWVFLACGNPRPACLRGARFIINTVCSPGFLPRPFAGLSLYYDTREKPEGSLKGTPSPAWAAPQAERSAQPPTGPPASCELLATPAGLQVALSPWPRHGRPQATGGAQDPSPGSTGSPAERQELQLLTLDGQGTDGQGRGQMDGPAAGLRATGTHKTCPVLWGTWALPGWCNGGHSHGSGQLSGQPHSRGWLRTMAGPQAAGNPWGGGLDLILVESRKETEKGQSRGHHQPREPATGALTHPEILPGQDTPQGPGQEGGLRHQARAHPGRPQVTEGARALPPEVSWPGRPGRATAHPRPHSQLVACFVHVFVACLFF